MLLGELIAAGLAGGASLDELTLNVSNVVVAPDENGEGHGDGAPPVGQFVAVSVTGTTDFGPDQRWWPGADNTPGLLGRLNDRLVAAGARFAYVRRLPPAGSVTVFLRRLEN